MGVTVDVRDRPSPDDALVLRAADPTPEAVGTHLSGASGVFERPDDLAGTLALLEEHPDAVLAAGSTDWGVDVNLRGARAPYVIGIDRLPELRGVTVGDDSVSRVISLRLEEAQAIADRASRSDRIAAG